MRCRTIGAVPSPMAAPMPIPAPIQQLRRPAGITIPGNGSAPDPTMAGGFTPLCIQYNPNIGGLGASKLTVTGSDAAGDAIYNWGTMAPAELTSAIFTTFSYSALLGGWFCNQEDSGNIAGINCGPP